MTFEVLTTGRGGAGNIKAATKAAPWDPSNDPDDDYDQIVRLKAQIERQNKPVSRLFYEFKSFLINIFKYIFDRLQWVAAVLGISVAAVFERIHSALVYLKIKAKISSSPSHSPNHQPRPSTHFRLTMVNFPRWVMCSLPHPSAVCSGSPPVL
jgi:hypothetical protein